MSSPFKKKVDRRRWDRPRRGLACPECGRRFDTVHPTKRFCSEVCCRLYYKKRSREAAIVKKRDAVNCRFCGKSFVPNHGLQRQCEDCHNRGKRHNILDRHWLRNCVWCGVEFSGRANQRYCCAKHRNAAMGARNRVIHDAVNCPGCGSETNSFGLWPDCSGRSSGAGSDLSHF